MNRRFTMLLVMAGLGWMPLRAQTITDGLMMPKKTLCTGFLYTHDQWEKYWQGTMKRENGNIGKITTQSLAWMGTYGITNKINVIAMLPYIKTKASMGTLQGQEGIQDLTVALKYNFWSPELSKARLRFYAVGTFSTPLTDYTPDFVPLALGAASTNLGGRLTGYFALEQGWFANASAGYTWRSNVTFDTEAHLYEGHLVNSHDAWMPNVFDYFAALGYRKHGIQAELNYAQQNTLGGDDILKQAMPFPYNKMNFGKVGALVMYYLPRPHGLAVRGAIQYTTSGRNVGQSTTLTGGLLYTFIFNKSETTLSSVQP